MIENRPHSQPKLLTSLDSTRLISFIERSRLLLITLLLSLSTIQKTAAQQQVDTLINHFITYNNDHLVEKVYLKTNREVLSLGDTLWFAGWTVLRHNLQPGDLSSLLYVELIGPEDNVLKRLPIAVDSVGRSQGYFALSDSLAAGQYHLRSYTRYQQNDPEDFYYHKTIEVLPRLNNQVYVEQLPDPRKIISVSLLPEGGHLVANHLNYLAFKVNDTRGLPLDISGQLVTDKEEVVTDFQSIYDGMGLIQFTPLPNEKYYFTFSLDDILYREELPEIKQEGYLLHVWQSPKKVYLSAKGEGVDFSSAYALIHHHGKVLSIHEKKRDQQDFYVSFESSVLPSGVITVTLFNAQNIAVAERIFYNENKDDFAEIKLEIKEKGISTREKLRIGVKKREKVNAQLSVSVVPAHLYQPSIENITSGLLLSTELRGKIHNPAHYIVEENAERIRHLDLLMLTHGWRKYSWEDILERTWQNPLIQPEKGFTVEGQVSSFMNREKPLETDLYLSFFENPVLRLEASSDSEGRFTFSNLEIEDTVTAFIKTMSDKERKRAKDLSKTNSYITVFQPNFPEVDLIPSRTNLLQNVDSATSERGAKLFDIDAAFNDEVIILDEFVIEEDKDPFQDPVKREFKLYGRPDERVVMDSLPSIFQFGTVFDMLRAQMPGVIITGVAPNQRISFQGRVNFGSASSSESEDENGASDAAGAGVSSGSSVIKREPASMSISNGGPLVLLNGMVTDVAVLNTIMPYEIEFIDVIKGPRAVAYGSRASEGVIAVYTKKGTDRIYPYAETPGFVKQKLPGFFPAKDFYVPDYENMTLEDKLVPDYRSTLFWEPKLSVIEGESEFSFYTSDEKGAFIISIEGLAEDGRIIQKIDEFTVR